MDMTSFAGKPVPTELIPDIPGIISDYYTLEPDPSLEEHRVSFGTSGHRGQASEHTFNEAHILAIVQAICNCRKSFGYTGPLFLGRDTHALSEPAHRTAIEVLAANGVDLYIAQDDGYTPTPVISRDILAFRRGNEDAKADGIVITPSHNPPSHGGLKYNPFTGGPASKHVTDAIAAEANRILTGNNVEVKRLPYARALACGTTRERDFITPYVADLAEVLDLQTIRASGIRIGADALGGAGLAYWTRIAEKYGLDITVMNDAPDPTFRFMRVDHDGQIRMDCSSPRAMAGLIEMSRDYDIAFGSDPDFDRHGIVTPSGGLMNPNYYLAVAVRYLFDTRGDWPAHASVGKTVVSSCMIDEAAKLVKRKVTEVPVGFKWFVDGLWEGTLGFGGEESAGASFLRWNGNVWTTDKDGFIMSLLAAEITAATGKDPAQHYRQLVEDCGRETAYNRTDESASEPQRDVLKNVKAHQVAEKELAGDPIRKTMTETPHHGESIGGVCVRSDQAWFALRPSGTEDKVKIYAESFRGAAHLEAVEAEAKAIMKRIFADAGVG